MSSGRKTEQDVGCRGTCTQLVDCMCVRYIYDSNNTVVLLSYCSIIVRFTSGCVFSSVQSLAHQNLCSDSPPHMEAVHRVAAAADPECDAAASNSMPQTETLMEKNFAPVQCL